MEGKYFLLALLMFALQAARADDDTTDRNETDSSTLSPGGDILADDAIISEAEENEVSRSKKSPSPNSVISQL